MKKSATYAANQPMPDLFQNIQDAFVWIQRNWFKAILAYFAFHLVFNRGVSLQFDESSAHQGIIAERTALRTPEPTKAQLVPAINISQLVDLHAPVAEPEVAKNEPTFSVSYLTPALSPTSNTRGMKEKELVVGDYVEKYAPVAQKAMHAYGIPASITLAQGLLESNAGHSKLARESNNHFGIKCRRKCRGCTCRNYTDDDVYDMFRVFTSVWDSYEEHSILLASPRYRHLLKYGKDYKNWAYGLKKAGYATDKRYAQKLIRIIENLNLHQYDR